MTILLDIDGVLVTTPAWKKCEILDDGFMSFDKNAVNNLNKIIETDVNIVLTSTHKDTFNCEQWLAIFLKRGLKITNIDRVETKTNRYDEIINYLNKISDGYIIIDDDTSLNDLPKNVKERLFITKSLIGLDKETTKKIIDKINESK